MRFLKVAGEQSEFGRYLAGDFRGVARRIEGVRIEPESAEALADDWVGEIVEEDAIAAGVREGKIGLAGQREVGEELDGVADIDGDQEGRPAFRAGKSLGVTLSLVVGVEHGLVPTVGAADSGATALSGGRRRWGCEGEVSAWRQGLNGRCVAALLGFQDEVTAAVEVDTAWRCRAVEVMESDRLFEDVFVEEVVLRGGVGVFDIEEIAKLGEEERVVGPLGSAGALPTFDKALRRNGHRRMIAYLTLVATRVSGAASWEAIQSFLCASLRSIRLRSGQSGSALGAICTQPFTPQRASAPAGDPLAGWAGICRAFGALCGMAEGQGTGSRPSVTGSCQR